MPPFRWQMWLEAYSRQVDMFTCSTLIIWQCVLVHLGLCQNQSAKRCKFSKLQNCSNAADRLVWRAAHHGRCAAAAMLPPHVSKCVTWITSVLLCLLRSLPSTAMCRPSHVFGRWLEDLLPVNSFFSKPAITARWATLLWGEESGGSPATPFFQHTLPDCICTPWGQRL